MKVVYSESIERSKEDLKLLQSVTQQLSDILGEKSAPHVTADWRIETDHLNRSRYKLSIRDDADETHTRFSRDELLIPDYLRLSLLGLWGDLLKIRNDKQHEKVQKLIGELIFQD